jgi:hypothetical protein
LLLSSKVLSAKVQEFSFSFHSIQTQNSDTSYSTESSGEMNQEAFDTNVVTSTTPISSTVSENDEQLNVQKETEDKETGSKETGGKESDHEKEPSDTKLNEWKQSSRANEGFDPQLVRRVILKKKIQKSLQQKATERPSKP